MCYSILWGVVMGNSECERGLLPEPHTEKNNLPSPLEEEVDAIDMSSASLEPIRLTFIIHLPKRHKWLHRKTKSTTL